MPDALPLIVRDLRFREHSPSGSHPERPERLAAVDAAIEPLRPGLRELEPRAADDEDLLRAHSPGHLEQLRSIEGRRVQLDPDTYAAPRSVEVARLAAGSLTDMAVRIAAGEAKRGFAAIRPPGHHAERQRAMGFCLINHVVVAVKALRARAGVERIAIVDWDVHHGNGTQHAFEAERDVLFVSTHQFPFYPGTGALAERGQGDGLGATVNVPLPAGVGDAEYQRAFERVVDPVLRAFRPELIVVSAGFDAHADDPLASMQLSSACYGALTAALRDVADEVCEGRLLLALEGGYDLDALRASVGASLRALRGEPGTSGVMPKPGPGWEPVEEELVAAHALSWPTLQSRTSGRGP